MNYHRIHTFTDARKRNEETTGEHYQQYHQIDELIAGHLASRKIRLKRGRSISQAKGLKKESRRRRRKML